MPDAYIFDAVRTPDAERAAQREAGRHPDHVEGVTAFLESRKATFGAAKS